MEEIAVWHWLCISISKTQNSFVTKFIVQQLSSIANVQNLPQSDVSSDKPSSSKSAGSKSEFELQVNRRQDGDSKHSREAEETTQTNTDETAVNEVEPIVTPLQLELYDFQHLDEATEPVSDLGEQLLPEDATTKIVVPETARPIPADQRIADQPLPLDRARQLIEVAAAAGPKAPRRE